MTQKKVLHTNIFGVRLINKEFSPKIWKNYGISYILQVQSYYKITVEKLNKAKQYKT